MKNKLLPVRVSKGMLGGPLGTSGGLQFAPYIFPTGTEILTNPGLEGPYSNGLASGWSKNGGAIISEETTIIHGGSASQKIVGVNFGDGVFQYKQSDLTAGDWVQVSAWAYRVAGSLDTYVRINTDGIIFVTSINSWGMGLHTGRYVSGNTGVYALQSSAAAVTAYLDDASVKKLSLPSCFGVKRFYTPTGDVIAQAELTCIVNTQVGFVVNLDDATTPKNFMLAYIDGAKAYLDKCVNGVYTSVIAGTAIPYGAGKNLKLTKNDTSYSLYYGAKGGEVQVGITQVVDEAIIKNNLLHAQFSAYELNQFRSFTINF
jgi:hypothetical protein